MRPPFPEVLILIPLLRRLGSAKKVVFFRKNQVIFSHGDRSGSIFYIQKGSVKLTVTSKQGKEAIIVILDGESFFGEDALASNRPPRAVNAIALTNLRSVRIDPDLMLHLIHTDPDACDVIISSLIALQVRMIERCADSLLYPRNACLTDCSSSIAQLHEGSEVRPIRKLSQQDLANGLVQPGSGRKLF